jgi:hypothetical protein
MKDSCGIWLTDTVFYDNDIIIAVKQDSTDKFNENGIIDSINVAGKLLAPWGEDNMLPQHILSQIDRAEIVGANADFNWKVGYGLGPKLVKLVRDPKNNKVVDFIEIIDGKEYDFFEENDIPFLIEEMLTDMSYFNNTFPVLFPEGDTIKWIRHKEAMFSRWGVDKKGSIISHLYCSRWSEDPSAKDIEESHVLDEFDPMNDMLILKAKRAQRICYPTYMPSPGRPYYSYPTWYSIFRSGWYDQITSIPALKKAILKNNLGVRYIIYISEQYFEDMADLYKVSKDDPEDVARLKGIVVDSIKEVLTGADNAGKTITSLKKAVPTGNGISWDKYIEIEPIKGNIESGEYLTDYETGANIISYAMGVHPSLIGATPGKNSNSLSGSNVREIFLMKQALTKPMIDRVLRPFSFIKKYNRWDKDIAIVIPEYIFTTLDQNKSGKQESTNTIAK